MLTLLPYEDFSETAKVLDDRRLTRARIHALECLNHVLGLPVKEPKKEGTPPHRLWYGYPAYLALYGTELCLEYIDRQLLDPKNLIQEFVDRTRWYSLDPEGPKWDRPPWLSDEQLHRSHRAHLVSVYPSYYGAFWPDLLGVESELYWPRNARWSIIA